MAVLIDGSPLTIDDVVAVAFGSAEVAVDPGLADRMAPARDLVGRVVAGNEIVYGITTGFGALSNTRIPAERAGELQYDLIRSHASGVGPLLDAPTVRAMLLCRARTLAQGHSGVRVAIVERLVDMLKADVIPAVPSQGSVGASGDLAPFAHLALPLIGEGEVLTDAGTEPAVDVLQRLGWEPHCPSRWHRNYIKRFYGVYPSHAFASKEPVGPFETVPPVAETLEACVAEA